MKTRRRFCARSERGFSLVELLVVVFVFALMVLVIDAVFATVNRSSRTVEVAVDVQQNARIAIERLSREIRLARASQNPSQIRFSNSPKGVAFVSARPTGNSRGFCLDAVNFNPGAWNCRAPSPDYGGTYAPVPQAWVVYWLDLSTQGSDCPSPGVLRRSVQAIQDPANPGNPLFSDGATIATCVSRFEPTLVGSADLSVEIEVRSTTVVQGAEIPVQQVAVTTRVFIRN